jgi:hypothetical protein
MLFPHVQREKLGHIIQTTYCVTAARCSHEKDFNIRLMNKRASYWSSYFIAGIVGSNLDEGMDVGPLSLLCVV